MSKIFLVGDTHLGLGWPNSVAKWYKVAQDYFENFFFPLLDKEFKEGDIIVHLGDLFDNRNVVPIDILNYGLKIVEKMATYGPTHIIVGNHDMWTKSLSEINTVRLYKYVPNVHIYEKPTKYEWNGKSILFMPYIEKKKDQVEVLKEYSGCDYLFCHSDLNGAKMHLTSVAHKNNDKIDVEEFGGYKLVRSGHIHLVQQHSNFTFVGSIFEMDRNDYGNQKGIFVLDTKDDSEVFHKNNHSPRFKKYSILKEDDIDGLDNLNMNDYIDLSISNSLLMNNRKLRRKLEVALEKGKFESVEYIDDIVEEGEQINESVTTEEETEEDIKLNMSSTLDFKEIIFDYVEGRKYDTTKIKNGVVSELNTILDIHRENYAGKK